MIRPQPYDHETTTIVTGKSGNNVVKIQTNRVGNS